MRIVLTGGNVNDCTQLLPLTDGLEMHTAVADRGYDADVVRAAPERRGIAAAIPTRKTRRTQVTSRWGYTERHSVKNFSCSFKDCCRVAQRRDKTAVSYTGLVSLAAAMVVIRQYCLLCS